MRAALLALLLAGCAHERVVIQPVEVRVPIPVPCAAPLPADPPREADKPADDIFVAMQRALAEIELWRAWGLEARAAVEGCQPQGGKR